MTLASSEGLAVVVGASGAIGRALIDALRTDARTTRIVALSRSRPADLPDQDGLTWLPVDLLDPATLAQAADAVAAIAPPTRVVVATGVLHGGGLRPEKSLRAVEPEALARAFQINAVGPALVARYFLPLTARDRPTHFAALSARVGSIADNATGGWYGYRASKAALNMIIRTAAIEHARSHPLGVCVAIHPGTVQTPLSQPFTARTPAGRLFTPAVAAGHILQVLDGLTPQQTGGFFAWDGSPIRW